MRPPAVMPLTTLAGWRQFVRRPPVQAPPDPPDEQWALWSEEQQAEQVEQRIGYHTELSALETPELRKIVTTGRALLLLNRRQYGARRGLLVSGDPTTGKSTAITQLGRAVEVGDRRLRPDGDDAAPVVYLTMPPQATPKSLSIEILKFLGAPYLTRDSQIELTRQACHLLADLRTELILVDEIHNLNHHTRAGAEASDHLKYLAENVASTFRLRRHRHGQDRTVQRHPRPATRRQVRADPHQALPPRHQRGSESMAGVGQWVRLHAAASPPQTWRSHPPRALPVQPNRRFDLLAVDADSVRRGRGHHGRHRADHQDEPG